MPIKKYIHYEFGGTVLMTLWTEAEVAAKLRMTIPKLREAIASGRPGIPYHIHENRYKKTRQLIKFTHKEYFFNESCWKDICQIAAKRKVQNA